MHTDFNIPPKSKDHITPSEVIAERLQELIGTPFPLVEQTRINGSRIRKLVAKTLGNYPLPELSNAYTILNSKGRPGILREYLGTYIVTSGKKSYNLQVWNRNPASKSVQIEYPSEEPLSTNDVRFIFVRVDVEKHIIRAILVLTPEYITQKFGPFGKPTIKYQLIIAPKTREYILHHTPPIIFYPDTSNFTRHITHSYRTPQGSMRNPPVSSEVLSLDVLRDKLVPKLIGAKLDVGSTKNRGQALEQLVALHLGYTPALGELLLGGYPDIPNQALEVKVQDSPTVDLGKYTPEFEETITSSLQVTTKDMRYLIALTNGSSGLIAGLILCPGAKLGDHFSYVAGQSYKCQRAIPMQFFDNYDGQALFNPDDSPTSRHLRIF